MVYSAQTWIDNNPSFPVSATRMAHLEAGIAANDAAIAGIGSSFAQWTPNATGTDDTTALNTFLSAAAGQQVRFKPGQAYKVSNSLTVPSGTKLDLTGATITQTASNKVTFNLASVTDVTVRGGKIVGKGTDYVGGASPTALGISVTGSTDVLIDAVRIENHAGAGVNINSTSVGVSVTNCRIKGTGATNITAGDGTEFGVVIDGGSSDVAVRGCNISDTCQGIITGVTASDVTLVDNKIHDIIGQHGMYIQNGTGAVITGNRVRTVANTGIKLQLDSVSATDSNAVTINNNNIDGTGGGGAGMLIVNIDAALAHYFHDLTVVGNTIRNSAAIGMQISDVRGGVVADNTVTLSAVDGIRVVNCQGLTVADNVINDTTQIGINLLAKTSSVMQHVFIRGNQIRNAATAGTTNLNYGIHIADGSDVTLESNIVTASHANMLYGIFFGAGDQASATFRDNYVANANSYGARLITATNVREWHNNNVTGTTGTILNPPPNINLNPTAVSCDVQTFATVGSFTWTKPAQAKMVRAEVIAGGPGGGSGRRGAAGSIRCGGGGGAGGNRADALLDPADLPSTMVVVVGAGGAGGAAVTANDTSGNNGSIGGDSTFGSSVTGLQVYARTGTVGIGGTAALGTGGTANPGMFAGGAGGTANVTGGTGGAATNGAAGGGGAGGGVTSADASSAGGPGFAANWSNTRGSSAGGTVGAGQAGTAGTAAPAGGIGGDGGGGGAGSITGAAGAGGDGGVYGGGGGGGGASLNGNNSGAGGAGGAGFVRVTTYF